MPAPLTFADHLVTTANVSPRQRAAQSSPRRQPWVRLPNMYSTRPGRSAATARGSGDRPAMLHTGIVIVPKIQQRSQDRDFLVARSFAPSGRSHEVYVGPLTHG